MHFWMKKVSIVGLVLLAGMAFVIGPAVAAEQDKPAPAGKPNILVIWGDDIGWNNPSAITAA